MRGISSLAKETTELRLGQDVSGATCINQVGVQKRHGTTTGVCHRAPKHCEPRMVTHANDLTRST